MNKIIQELNYLKQYILDNAYIEDFDGYDEDTKIIIQRYSGLNEDNIKSLLDRIDDIMALVKEEYK